MQDDKTTATKRRAHSYVATFRDAADLLWYAQCRCGHRTGPKATKSAAQLVLVRDHINIQNAKAVQ